MASPCRKIGEELENGKHEKLRRRGVLEWERYCTLMFLGRAPSKGEEIYPSAPHATQPAMRSYFKRPAL